jgi:two-component system CheB/CheR fusion protein
VLFRDYPLHETTAAALETAPQKRLQQEMLTLKEDISSVIEELESANDALQLLNEEVVSINEELQTLNEELQTSKEEMESSNEELSSVNAQLRLVNEQFRETLEYTDGIIATISEAIIVLNKNLMVKSANASFYNIFGRTVKDTEGFYLFGIGDGQFDIPGLKGIINRMLPEHQHFSDFQIEHDFGPLGKKTLLVNGRLFVQKAQDEELYFITIRDISDHIRAVKWMQQAEWFHDVANMAPVMIWVAEEDRQFTFFNETWRAFTGRGLKEEVGEAWMEGIHPDDRDEFIRQFNEAFDKQEPLNVQYRFRRYDGQYRWLLNNGVSTYLGDGFTGYIGTCTDVHHQKMFSEELERRVNGRTIELVKANDDFRRTNTELEQYAYIASHDLQEPLRKLQTFADILSRKYEQKLPAGAVEYVHKMTACSQRMTQLIQDLLNFSSIAGVQEKFEETDLNIILNYVLEDFNLADLPVMIHAEPLPVLEAIPLHMKQLLQNLVSNAIKFRKKNQELVIHISSRILSPEEVLKHNLAPGGTYCELLFRDNGIGFDPSFSEQIFVIFKRLKAKQSSKGTGIGLALCRKIVLNHQGEIYAESNGKDGASFYILLPLQQPAMA